MKGENMELDICRTVDSNVPNYNCDLDHNNPEGLQRYLVLAQSAAKGLAHAQKEASLSTMTHFTST